MTGARPNVSSKSAALSSLQAKGRGNHHAGLAAEEIVAQDYARRGYPTVARRWRGRGGEIDLIVQDGDGLVFVEVKQSRTHDTAVHNVTPRQMARLQGAAEEFLAIQPRGALTDVRFDVALIDGHGQLKVIENAFGQL